MQAANLAVRPVTTTGLSGSNMAARPANVVAGNSGAVRKAVPPGASQAARGVYDNTVAGGQPVNMPARLGPAPVSNLQAAIATQYPWTQGAPVQEMVQAVQPYMQNARQGILQQMNQADPSVMQGVRQQIRQGLQGTGALQDVRQDARQALRQQMLAAGQAVDPVAIRQAAQQAAQQYVGQQARQQVMPFLNQQALPAAVQNYLGQAGAQALPYFQQGAPALADAGGSYAPVGQQYNPMAQVPQSNYGAGLRNFLSAMGYGI